MPEALTLQGTLLGFDFGLRRIGVAAGQTMTGTAGSLEVVRHADQPDWRAIERLVSEWRPCAFVVGLPLDGDGNETEMSRQARQFGSQLASRFDRPVYYMDERLSSAAAQEQFVDARAQGRVRAKGAKRLDARAAQIILENWLQSQSGH
ncbi:MAG: Holliday junction resolvase RuvX [Xanthomonadales bacterium]|nr:Holliday junction resolvase RuvX [Gammaproteobacteria bacterium]NNE04268.1 Holliday junction resolvase RuvX [Xanthomonadales bacterium]NNL95622.1 Holliday junction resolvase RuvX [Xanthomonadales bacterium]